MLKREISERLYSWKNENKKKALCVIGARQIGKTTIIREFARKEYEYFVEEIRELIRYLMANWMQIQLSRI